MAAQVGAHGRRVMEAIEGGRRFRRDGAGWRAGALAVPDSLILELKRHDLVKEGPEGLALPGPCQSLDRAGRAAGSTEQADGGTCRTAGRRGADRDTKAAAA
jgi:hypothetical protein